jgi:hypothetical protein
MLIKNEILNLIIKMEMYNQVIIHTVNVVGGVKNNGNTM